MMNPGNLKVTTPSDREIEMTRAFNAPRQLVFDAYTKPELLKRWFHGPDGWSLVVCEVDLRVDGAYRFVWRSPEKADMGLGGVYRTVTPPEKLVSTEIFDEDWTGGETLVSTTFVEDGTTTTLTMNVLYSSQEARDAAACSGMEHGVAAAFDRLEKMMLSGDIAASTAG